MDMKTRVDFLMNFGGNIFFLMTIVRKHLGVTIIKLNNLI